MPRVALCAVYLAGLLIAEGLRAPWRLGRFRSGGAWRRPSGGRGALDALVLAAVIAGIWVLPAVYVFTDRLRALDYALPAWTAWPAIVVFALGIVLRAAAQTTLGRAWSPTVELADAHRLVTHGIYAWIRHPIYTSLLFWGAAQPLLLHNVAAGWGGPLAVALIWLVRVPAEERMMVERFGEDYLRYSRRTGRMIPRRT